MVDGGLVVGRRVRQGGGVLGRWVGGTAGCAVPVQKGGAVDVAAPRGVNGQQQVVGLIWRRRDPEAAEDLRQVRGLNVAVPAGELVEERLGKFHEIVVRVHRPDRRAVRSYTTRRAVRSYRRRVVLRAALRADLGPCQP